MKVIQSFALFILGPLYYLRKYPLFTILGVPVFILLTVVTQVGGLIFWWSFAGIPWGKRWLHPHKFWRFLLFQLTFYILASLFLIPVLARISNPEPRIALPIFASGDFPAKPRNIFFCLLNRHYLTQDSYEAVENVSTQLHQKYSDTYLIYYDANFPFAWKSVTSLLKKGGLVKNYMQGFPLYPHLSHEDGKKLDVGFFYLKNGKAVNFTPSWIGYGALEAPKTGEVNIPCMCKNYWNYNFWLYLQSRKPCEVNPDAQTDLVMDQSRTRDMILLFLQNPDVQKILLEAHLDYRMGLGQKTRLAGCHATRHDDHLHIAFQ